MTDKNKKATDDKKATDESAEEPKAEESKDEKPDSGPAAPADDSAAPAGTDQQGRQLHDVKCAECGKQTQVPFKPSGDRPVYCRDCYMKRKGSGR